MISWATGLLSGVFKRRHPGIFLACWWIAGLLLGLGLYLFSGASSNMCVWDQDNSVASGELVIRVLLPFLLCLIGILLDQSWLIYGCAFGKAFLFSFVSLCVIGAFGSGGWLVRCFILFTDTLMCAVWYVFWQDSLRATRLSFSKAISLCAAGLLLAGLDVRMISPLVMRLFNS